MTINLKGLPKLPSHKFDYETSGQHQGESFFMIENNSAWKPVGWCPNSQLRYQRNDDSDLLLEGDEWIAVRFEKENGEAIWFHIVRCVEEQED